jgi:predicted nucleic acid-binding Zn ribbon protein
MPEVTCVNCGMPFDPAIAEGWCTNTECGQYNYYDDGNTCPNCSRSVGKDADFCPGCGASLDGPKCPGCGGDVEPDHAFCSSCGHSLQDDDACPVCGADVDPDQAYCTSCGEKLDGSGSGGSGSESSRTPRLSLDCGSRDVVVPEGGTLGTELRQVAIQQGTDQQRAQRIHRQHARFHRDDGKVYLTHEGKNPLRHNGRVLKSGETVEVAPGDTLEFSGTVDGRLKPL